MSDLVPPPDAKDAFKTSAYMKSLQSIYVTMIWDPCITTVEEDRNANGFVTATLVTVVRLWFKGTQWSSRSEFYPLLNFIVQVTVNGEYVAKISEVMYLIIERITMDCEDPMTHMEEVRQCALDSLKDHCQISGCTPVCPHTSGIHSRDPPTAWH